MKNILEDLNEEQQKAVENTEGPAMVIAGAGSGKTRVLTYRVAYLLEKGADPFHILALTFTNKAAREMKERIMQLIGTEARNVWMGTFHSVFARILRSEANKIGYPSNFTIYDNDDSKSVIKSIIKELGLDDKAYQPGYVLYRISAAKSNLISDTDYNNNTEIIDGDQAAGKPYLGKIYTIYNKRCKNAAAMDFDDLLFNTNLLLRDFPEVLHKYQHKFQYILVDEYQDTNFAQYLIVKKLAARHENICVVGDDAQSIYAFRGANIQNILNFKENYPDYKLFKLEQNYRSTQTILNAANGVIATNKDQILKKVWTKNDTGSKIRIIRALSDNEEGVQIANSIFEAKMNFQLPHSSFAVLYRTNVQSRAIEEALRKLKIPYRIYGGLSFYKRREIKDLLAYFRLVINNQDEEALMRVINYPARGIGKTTIDKLRLAAAENGTSIWQVIAAPGNFNIGLNQGTLTKINDFVTKIRSFSVKIKKQNAYELAKDIAASAGILKELHEDKTPEGINRFENIEELLNGIKEFAESQQEGDNGSEQPKTLDTYMQDIALLTNLDEEDKDDMDKVSLMTAHSAKGLEFPHVYISGLEENLFPTSQSLGSRQELEEERRLFYVALTRAKQSVTLSYSESRYRWGNLIFCEPSRFIEEIEDKYIEFPVKARSGKEFFEKQPVETMFDRKEKTAMPRNLKKINSLTSENTTETNKESLLPLEKITPGMTVIHARFGKGKVLNIEGNNDNRKATVEFGKAGKKQLLLKFAKLQIAEE